MSKLALAATLLATSFSAFADGATYDYPVPAVSNITRAQVMAETRLAIASGSIVQGEQSYVAPAVGRANSRAEVQQALALALARASGQLFVGELYHFADEAHASSGVTARVDSPTALR
ncbi:MAG: DUF4148 domain-containing protein [Burkholderiales bacterium]|nr:DUF4148 domain-containing protein [Burkholderiales bacterium]